MVSLSEMQKHLARILRTCKESWVIFVEGGGAR